MNTGTDRPANETMSSTVPSGESSAIVTFPPGASETLAFGVVRAQVILASAAQPLGVESDRPECEALARGEPFASRSHFEPSRFAR